MDEFTRADAFFGLQAIMAGANTPTFEQIESEHPKLVKQIAAFEPIETSSVLAALLSYPSLHANTVRLELLQNLVHRNAQGINKPTRHRFSIWLNNYLGKTWAARMEDPVDGVFISNVVSHIGNSRIFEGVWEANDFWLQQALDALRRFQDEEWAKQTFAACFALLQLSDALADRCKLERYCMGNGNAHESLLLPEENELGADKSYGDLDILSWTTSGSIFYAVECKRLRFARTVSEVGEQLREFRGEEMDRLAKHLRRCEWLRHNKDSLRRISKTKSSQLNVVPLLVASTIVPMQFISGLPLPSDRIVAFTKLRNWIASQ
jgi:hypothetical protein